MSEEEKEAIKVLNNFNSTDCGIEDTQAIETILNLIEKQQKEISLLKDQLEYLKSEYEEGYKLLSYSLDNYISKDKIRAKIEELEKEQENNRKSLYNAINILYFKEIDKISNRISVNMAVRDILQSLLEEE